MKQFRVTITMSFEPHYWDDEFSTYEESRAETKAKKAAFERTDAYFAEHNVIDYIKRNSAMEAVEYIFCNSEVKSAKWDPETFQIHMVVESDETVDSLREDLTMNSLEDGEYEGCGDSAWMVFTRGPNGEPLGPPWDMKDVWEYGLVDYRNNPIVIEEVA
jgi:hypothetical protein